MTRKAIEEQHRQNTEAVIRRTIETFPIGSPIIIDDIRFAAKVDGFNLDDVDGQIIAKCLAKMCDPVVIRNKDRTSWYRRPKA